MTFHIPWEESALVSAARFLKDDPDGIRQVFNSVDLLAEEPRPAGTATYGSPGLRRMHAGRCRLIYEVPEGTVTVMVLHLGRAA